jgi:hypothetical protein
MSINVIQSGFYKTVRKETRESIPEKEVMKRLTKRLFIGMQVHRLMIERRKKESYDKNFQESDEPNRIEKPDMINDLEQNRLAKEIVRVAEAWGSADRQGPMGAFGIKLGAIRRQQGLELKELAARTSIDENTLLAIELGAVPFQQVADSLKVLGDALGGKYVYLSRLLLRLVLS